MELKYLKEWVPSDFQKSLWDRDGPVPIPS